MLICLGACKAELKRQCCGNAENNTVRQRALLLCSALLWGPFLIPSAALLTGDFALYAAAPLFLLERHFTTCMWQLQPPKVVFLPALVTVGPWQSSTSQPTQLWGQEQGWSRLALPRATWAPPQCSQLQETGLVELVPLGTTVSPVRSH